MAGDRGDSAWATRRAAAPRITSDAWTSNRPESGGNRPELGSWTPHECVGSATKVIDGYDTPDAPPGRGA